MKIEDVAIIGAGPAGLSTAIQLKRSGIEPLLLEKLRVGGLLNNANMVDNYPGFPNGIPGPALVELFKKHLDRVGVEVRYEEVLQMDHNEYFTFTTSGRKFQARVAVVASGTKPKYVSTPEVPVEAAGRVFTEVYPILEAQDCRIGVIGAGDAAFDYGLNLARNNKVYVLNSGKKTRCLPLLWEKAGAEGNIEYLEDTSVKTIKAGDGALVLLCGRGQSTWELPVDYVIFATGRTENTDFLSDRLKDQASDLEADGLLYFVGDVKNGNFRQSSIAIGQGISAAMRVYKKLKGFQ